MAIFGPKPWVNPLGKNVNSSTFWTSCFYSLERRFFVLEYHKRHFPCLYCLKKKLEKWPFSDQNHGLTPQKKYQFFYFLVFLFFQPGKAFLSYQNIIKTFSWNILPKKKSWKMAVFGPKPWVNPLGKNINISTFRTSCFYSLESRFFVLEYHKRHFPRLYCQKKNIRKMAIFGPKPWANPLGKMSIFRLFGLLDFIGQKGVFSFQNIIKDIFLAYIA